MLIMRIETPNIILSKCIAELFRPGVFDLVKMYGLSETDVDIIGMPSRVEENVGIVEIYMDSKVKDKEINEGILVKIDVNEFDVENSQYSLLLHEEELFKDA